jgi:hypothetical protein
LVTGEGGKPVELGRGAMGVTYKGFDINLRCPVTLKVIHDRCLGYESARLRFLREARAAASVRHPNVASVLHLGRTGSSYFYAMEFVEGETLDHLIKRSGRLDVQLALEIATQVAAGLAAIYQQNLVHRDIKPTQQTGAWKECNRRVDSWCDVMRSMGDTYVCPRRFRTMRVRGRRWRPASAATGLLWRGPQAVGSRF